MKLAMYVKFKIEMMTTQREYKKFPSC